MSSEDKSNTSISSDRGRGGGRGNSRGGLGKYLRARGQGRGKGRPAEFHKRLVLEDEETIELEPDSEEAKELARRYGKRQLRTNADRYVEPEPVLNSDGEEEKEPEVDLSALLARQRLDDIESMDLLGERDEEADIDVSVAHLIAKPSAATRSQKGKIQSIEWDEELEEIHREKKVADANRELKNRFKLNVEKQRSRRGRGELNASARDHKKERHQVTEVIEAPPLPSEEITASQKSEKQNMEDFLDELLS